MAIAMAYGSGCWTIIDTDGHFRISVVDCSDASPHQTGRECIPEQGAQVIGNPERIEATNAWRQCVPSRHLVTKLTTV